MNSDGGDGEHPDCDAVITVKREQRGGVKRPVLHVTMPDGRVTEFRERAIVVPENSDDEIFALLVNGKGEVFVTPENEPVLLSVPAYGVTLLPDKDRLISYKAVAALIGKSTRHVRRMVEEGVLPQPVRTGVRAVRFNEAEVREAVSQMRRRKEP
jgi:excisionase family DNA binding protein